VLLTVRRPAAPGLIVARVEKLLMVASLAAFAGIVTFDNIADYGSNYAFVQHVLSTDTTFPDTALRDRAITAAAARFDITALAVLLFVDQPDAELPADNSG